MERTKISFSCQKLKHNFLLMQPTAQSLILLSYSISISCKLCYPTHSKVPAVKQAVTMWGLPDLIVPQGVWGTNNFLNTNAMKQTSSYTSEFFLSWSKNSPHCTEHDRLIRVFASIFWYWLTDMHCLFSVKWYDYHHKLQGIHHFLACSSTWVFVSPSLP